VRGYLQDTKTVDNRHPLLMQAASLFAETLVERTAMLEGFFVALSIAGIVTAAAKLIVALCGPV
jgi:hypothetical protein